MTRRPFFHSAPPQAHASIRRGLKQIDRGEGIDLAEVAQRLKEVADQAGMRKKPRPNPHVGTSLDSFLKEECIYDEVLARAAEKKRGRKAAVKRK